MGFRFRGLASIGLAMALTLSATSLAAAAKPTIDPTYANGQTVYMIGAHLNTSPSPQLLQQAQELYLVVYPLNPTGSTTLGRLTLPSGYQPQCDPCFHPGLPLPFVYHDHVITGSPGQGTSGTAGQFKAPWKIIVVMYSPAVALSPSFAPVTSVAALDAAEANGWFLPINHGGANPFEVQTGHVLICPLVSSHA